MSEARLNPEVPFVSILMPLRNEAAYVERCFKAIFSQTYPHDHMEILVADGESSDGTAEKIIALSHAADMPVSVWTNPGKIVPTGLNLLIPRARGDVLIRVDGHCEIAPDYVSQCVAHLQEDRVDGVGGAMQTIGEDFISSVTALAMSSKFGVGNSSFRTEVGKTRLADTVPFPAYTLSIVRKVGLYDEELVRNQDDEYNYRIRQQGGRILLADSIKSVYYSRGSLPKMGKQYFQYGFWKVRVFQKHPRQMSLRQFVPPLFVLALLLGVIMTFAIPGGWKFLAGLGGVYLLCSLGAAVLAARGKDWRALPLLPLAFLILHLSYGSGFLVGLIAFAYRWGDKTGKVPEWIV